MLKQVVVIGDSDAAEDARQAAYEAGRVIAEVDAVLISGGRGGVMEAASRGAREAGGLVIAILPGESFAGANPYADVVIPSGIGFARNMVNVLSGHVVVVIGGASGTLSELAYAWNFNKPILAFSAIAGVSMEYAGKKLDKRRKDGIIDISNSEDLRTALRNQLG